MIQSTRRIRSRGRYFWWFGWAILWAGIQALPAGEPQPVTIEELDGRLRIEVGGQLFTEYHYGGGPRPYFYPVHGPGGAMMTRHWPMREAPNEDRDHPHQKSLWFTHGSVNGVDFWADGPNKGRIVHDKFVKIESGDHQGRIQARYNWVGPDGKIVCTEDRGLRIQGDATCRMVDWKITLHASHGPVILGDTKEGSMAIRLAETMRLKGKVGQGHIVNSEGVRDDKTWGKRAKWCYYYGPVDDQTVGVGIFDHPRNPRHPTWWHVRDYGLFAANPFGIHDFERQAAGTGDFVLPEGKSVTFRYRFVFTTGDEKQAAIAKKYQAYATDESNLD